MVAPLWPCFRPFDSLPSFSHPLPPTFPLLFTRNERRWVIDDNFADLCYGHTYTHPQHPPHRPHLSLSFASSSSGSHVNNVVAEPEWGQGSNGETYCAVKAVCKWPINNQRPCISRCNMVPVWACLCLNWGEFYIFVFNSFIFARNIKPNGNTDTNKSLPHAVSTCVVVEAPWMAPDKLIVIPAVRVMKSRGSAGVCLTSAIGTSAAQLVIRVRSGPKIRS